MRVVVCVKAVPSTTEVKMDPETNTIVRDGKQAVVNPFDASALEVALAASDAAAQTGADPVRVTALSMGIPATETLLRDCIARGADDALLLSDRAFAGADTLATTYALSCGINALGGTPDLVVCGKMAVDGDTAQIGPELAGSMDIPCITDVSEILSLKDGVIVARHAVDDGEEVVKVKLPAVITVSKDIAQLRMPSIAGVRIARDAQVKVLDATHAHADVARCGLAGSPTQVVRSFVPEHDHVSVSIEGTAAEQAEELAKIFEGIA